MSTETAQPAPETSTDEVAIGGASPQMLASLLAGVILFGVVVSGAYIAVRRSSAPSPSVAAVPVPAPAKPSAPASPLPPAAPSPLVVAEPKPPVAIAVAAPAVTITSEETRGHTFMQVGAVERAAGPQLVKALAAKGFTARIAEGPDPSIVRLLVGPLSGPELTAMRTKLTAAGVASFPKAY